jgi:hypothetical protein
MLSPFLKHKGKATNLIMKMIGVITRNIIINHRCYF